MLQQPDGIVKYFYSVSVFANPAMWRQFDRLTATIQVCDMHQSSFNIIYDRKIVHMM